MKRAAILIVYLCMALPCYPIHMVQDTMSYITQQQEVAETINVVKTGMEQVKAVTQVYNQLREVYDVVGRVRNALNNFSGIVDRVKNSWSLGSFKDLDDLMTTADTRLSYWGIYPSTTGVLGDAMSRVSQYKLAAYSDASDVENLQYNFSRDTVLSNLFSSTSRTSGSGNGLLNLFSGNSVVVKAKEDVDFALTESGIKAKSATGELLEMTQADKILAIQKTEQDISNKFIKYAEQQTAVTALKANALNDILNNTGGQYTDDVAGAMAKATDVSALQIAATNDVTAAVNQNTATNLQLSQLMQEANKAKAEIQDMANYANILE